MATARRSLPVAHLAVATLYVQNHSFTTKPKVKVQSVIYIFPYLGPEDLVVSPFLRLDTGEGGGGGTAAATLQLAMLRLTLTKFTEE